MGVETMIDGKHCLFTADNFLPSGPVLGHRRMDGPQPQPSTAVMRRAPRRFSTSRRSGYWPSTAGRFEFSAEDFRRRVEWGKVGIEGCQCECVPRVVISATGTRTAFASSPVLQKAKPGPRLKGTPGGQQSAGAPRETEP